jgi:hypothetical protein
MELDAAEGGSGHTKYIRAAGGGFGHTTMYSSSNSGRLLHLADALSPSPISILLTIYTTKTNLVVNSPMGSRTEKDNQDAGRGREKSTPLCSRELLLLQRNSRYNCCNHICSSCSKRARSIERV